VIAESDLVRRAAKGDESAFLIVCEQHRDEVYRFASWMLTDSSGAEDVTQESFLALLDHPSRFDPVAGSLRTFLLAIARNFCRNRLRKLRPEEDLDVEEASGADLLDRAVQMETSEMVQSAIAALPPLQREVVFLFEYEELPMAEIASLLATDVNTIKGRLYRARQRLRRELLWMKT
jgi:RNA polymerase sigma-70 factor (ECF subfamily)